MTTPVVAVVPARYDSSRFPGKPLADLLGVPMVVRVVRQVAKAERIDRVLVATDDERIFDAVQAAGAEAVMTRPAHASGTDRVAEVIDGLGGVELAVNVQGDEPLIDPADIDVLVREALESNAPMGTLARPISDALDVRDPNIVKVVRALSGRALYFSRARIPAGECEPPHPLQHIGLYAYRPEALRQLAELPPSPLEKSERLEQLRAIEHGIDIHVALAHSKVPSIAVDVPEDVDRVIQFLKREESEDLSNATT